MEFRDDLDGFMNMINGDFVTRLLLVCYSRHFTFYEHAVYQYVMNPLNIAAAAYYIYVRTRKRVEKWRKCGEIGSGKEMCGGIEKVRICVGD